MSINVDSIIIFCTVVLVSGTSCTTTKASRIFQPLTSSQTSTHGYLPILNSVFAKLPQHAAFIDQATNNALESVGTSDGSLSEYLQDDYSHLKPPPSTDLKSLFSDQWIKSVTDKQRSLKRLQSNRDTTAAKAPVTSRPSSTSRSRSEGKHRPNMLQRSSYQVREEVNEYLTSNSNHAVLSDDVETETVNAYRNSQDVTTAIKALDHFLSKVLNDDSYNSELHPPPNPVLALVLSRYGRYLPGPRNSRVYGYMTANNIHNSKPFGNYKVECEQVPTYVQR